MGEKPTMTRAEEAAALVADIDRARANLERDRGMREHYSQQACEKALRACFEAIRKGRQEVATYQRQASRWSSAVDDDLKKLARIESVLIKEA
jgi:hypothetical protein